MRKLGIPLLGLTLAGLSVSADAVQATFVMGIGHQSCGAWLAKSGQSGPDFETKASVSGFWTALNWIGPDTHTGRGTVGYTTDSDGIVGEVAKECAANPSESFVVAVGAVHFLLDKRGQ